MKKIILLLTISALMVGCGEDNNDTAPAVKTTAGKPDILNYIPADTPMLMTSGLYPEQYPDKYIQVMQDNMDGITKYFKVMLENEFNKKSTEFVTTINEDGEEIITEEANADEAAMKAKIKNFADRWFTDDVFAQLGIKMGETQLAAYMVDLFPVLRIKLSANNQVNAFLADIEKEFSLEFVTTEVNGKAIKELQSDKATFLISQDDDYLVISAAPTVIKDQMIGQLIGVEKPAQSMAADDTLIQDIKKAHGYVIDDLFLIDLQQIADHFINPAKHNSPLVNFMQIEDNMLSAACKSEMTAMIAKAPRLVAGSKVLTEDTIKASFVWEMDQTIATDMATLAGRIPQGNDAAAMSFGMSFDLLAAKDLVSKYVDAAIAEPYACEHFARFNPQLADMQAKLNQPIPPFVGNFKGFNFSLDELKLNMAAANADQPRPKDVIESLKTQVFLAVDETPALLGMAQMMVPQLQGMELKTDGSLITLADKVPMIAGKDIPIDVAHLYAAVSENTIGISLGHEGGGALDEKVKQAGDNVLMNASMSVDGYKQLMEQIFSMAEMPNMPATIKAELAMQKELTLGMLYWKTQDMSLSFTDKGLTTDISYTY